jgi:hypothetical protein
MSSLGIPCHPARATPKAGARIVRELSLFSGTSRIRLSQGCFGVSYSHAHGTCCVSHIQIYAKHILRFAGEWVINPLPYKRQGLQVVVGRHLQNLHIQHLPESNLVS